MDINKSFSVIDDGFRTTVRSSLISKPYPYLLQTSELVVSSEVLLLSGELREVLFEETLIDSLQSSPTIILNGELTTTVVEIKDPQEYLNASATIIVAGDYRTVVINNNAPIEQVTASATTIVAGEYRTVVVNNTAPNEQISASATTILAGTLQ